MKRLGSLNYLVKTGNQTKKVHVDHLLADSVNVSDPAPPMIGMLLHWICL